jgi:flagellar biogenesis protein FliO
MSLPVTILGSYLIAASVAASAEQPTKKADEPWWSNSPTATSSEPGPKTTAYGPEAALRPGPKVVEGPPPTREGRAAEFAPDPPRSRHSDNLPAAFEQDLGPASKAAEKARHDESTPRNRSEPGETLSAAGSVSTTTTGSGGTSPALLPPATTDTATALSLGSHSDKTAGAKTPATALVTVGGSLAVVLGLFFFVAWAMRKAAPRGSLVLPKEVFDILGRAPLGARQQVQLLRCGSKLLLVSITPSGTETLTEVTDPVEVDRIAGICQQAHPKSATSSFRQVFQQTAAKSSGSTELDQLEPAGMRRKRYRWEEKNA